MRNTVRLVLLVAPAALASCRSDAASVRATEPVAAYVRFDGIGPHTRDIRTAVPSAQRAFDQGLAFLWSFNHDEAISAFTEVTRLDPQCPMGFWGLAVSQGPHINNPAMPPERERGGWEAAQRAVALQAHATPADRALIEAVARRYSDAPAPDRAALDRSYAKAMRAAWAAHPGDADVGTLCAEALMDLHPWDLWTPAGEPKEGAEEIVALLERVLALDPDHPGALHLYIHAVEASRDPGRALAAADRLRDLVPASGHMRHMPSHIDVLLGHWDEAIASNQRALEADAAYRAVRPRQQFHHMYMAHNNAMLSFAAMMDGRSAQAVEAARLVLPGASPEWLAAQAGTIEPSFTILYDALIRFGRWEEMLAEPEPPDVLPVARALRHHARGVALAALDRVPEAQAEQRAFREAAAAVPEDRVMSINKAHHIFDLAGHVLAGEIAWRQGDVDTAVAELREAIALEDQLAYMEPPEWPLPVRHALGAILLSAGRLDEAEATYREDLASWPENGWSLHGLADCLRRKGDAAAAAQVDERFREAWSEADVKIGSSCLCVAKG